MTGVVLADEDSPCHQPCKQNMQIYLGYNCEYTLTPDDVLHYPPPTCSYVINVYDNNNQPIGPTVNSSHVGQLLNVKVSNGSWFCWATIFVHPGNGGGNGPVAVCDVNTQVSLGSDGKARIYWQTFDDGSYVDCGEVAQIKVRRDVPGWCPPDVVDDTQFRDYVEFCCEDVQNSPVKVILRVYDNYGNFNDCWVNVWVEDHLHPSIHCPPDITVSCDYPIDYNHLHHFGKVHMNQSSVQPIHINDPHYYPNGHAGYDGYVGGGACGGNYWVVETYHADLTCGSGVIYRTFTIENTNYSCTQKIYVRDPYPFNGSSIHWPPNVELPDCGPNNLDPDVTGRPSWYDEDCSLIATSYRDEVFTVVPGACFKVLRHWSVLDWCTYQPNHPYGQGRWDHTQVIKLKNSDAPQFNTCEDVTFCTTEVYECSGKAPLYGDAYDDCTPDDLINYHWCIDINNDGVGPYQGIYDATGDTKNASGYYPFGTHKIFWRVEDLCGNFNTCSYLFTVEDCKKPSPVCLGALSTVVMPASGMIELNARHFDASSFDNCTPNEHLIFSYSPDVTETTRIFDCNNIGTNEVEIWVTDEAGNQQYCTAYLVLDDNDNVCPDSAMSIVQGLVQNVDGDPIVGTEVKLITGSLNINNHVTVGDDGQFGFGSFAQVPTTDFELSIEKMDDPLNGVSVLDLLLLQRHILEMGDIDDPYMLAAADVNNDDLVDARDLLETKQVMLNIRSMFSQNTSWVYMNEDHTGTPQEAGSTVFNVTASTDAPADMNIIGVKLADIDNSAIITLSTGETRTTNFVEAKDVFVNQGETVEVALKAIDFTNIAGYQFDLAVHPRKASVVDVKHANGTSIDFNMVDDMCKLVYVDAREAISDDIVYVTLQATRAAWLSELVRADLTDGTLVNAAGDEVRVGLRFSQDTDANQADVVDMDMQIVPNPFVSSTDIIINNKDQVNGELSIVDQNGRIIRSQAITADQKIVRMTLSSNELPASGLYWVKTRLDNQILVEKLMLIK